MEPDILTPEELWAKQQISSSDVNYDFWDRKRDSIKRMAQLTGSCIFTVDVFRNRYDFASGKFSNLFGYHPSDLRDIRFHGDLLQERIHPEDRLQITGYQIEHGHFIYSQPAESRNNYSQVFQFRIKDAHNRYINVISRQQVLETDKKGKAWIIMGKMDISPDQLITGKTKRTVFNKITGKIVEYNVFGNEKLTSREYEILLLIRQGLLSKEIADKLHLSIHTVNNHRKNILEKLDAGNSMEAVNILFGGSGIKG